MTLWYKNAAETWIDCLPLGNGSLGLMLDGGTFREKIFLNDDTLWSGCPKTENGEKDAFGKKFEGFRGLIPKGRKAAGGKTDGGEKNAAAKNIERLRGLILKGHKFTAENLLRATSPGDISEAYMPLGTVFIDYKIDGQINEYSRELNLETALHTSKFNAGGNLIEKRTFCSFPDKCGVMNIRSVRKISLDVSFNTPLEYDTSAEGEVLFFIGRAPDINPAAAFSPIPVQLNQPEYKDKGMAFAGGIRIITDGTVADEGGAISVNGATDVLLVFKSKTGFASHGVQPETRAEPLKAAVKNFFNRHFDFDYMYERHLNDYSALFKRVKLKLTKNTGGKSASIFDKRGDLPTDELLASVRRGAEPPPFLVELYYNYGRYLLIASSRQGSEPANLQGIWNKEPRPPWSSNYTLNINTQMNYWAAGGCNLSECLEPFKRFVTELSENGKKTAEKILGVADGFAAFHNSDIWRKTSPVKGDLSYAFFPTAGVWLVNEIYTAYTRNAKYLAPSLSDGETENVFSLLESCCKFADGWLAPYKEYYVTCPSSSPENKYKQSLFKLSLDYASACDMSLIRQVVENYRELSEKLGVSSALLDRISEKEKKLYPLKIGRNGILEWHEEYAETEPGHRHFSPLYGLYPGNLIKPGKANADAEQKALTEACAKFLDRRLDCGSASTGWSAAWAAALYARLKNGEKAYACIKKLLEQFTFPNLFDKHPPNIFQIDGNLGAVAAINEMLIQNADGINEESGTSASTGVNGAAGTVELLPALPDALSDGYVSGLIAQGGFAVDMRWQNKRVVSLSVRAPSEFKDRKLAVKRANLSDGLFAEGDLIFV
ncbi:MAG: glycoside hydrolase family 95 protein [Clostridiales bacterium]|jgi:alpha-L-fucosidase 2|nr:glycoside hydrolase family 95 protein [Clostridiales bacterium]